MCYALIMAGGVSIRLWPLSRRGRPKQSLKLVGERTMFEQAVDRIAPLFQPERIFVPMRRGTPSSARTWGSTRTIRYGSLGKEADLQRFSMQFA